MEWIDEYASKATRCLASCNAHATHLDSNTHPEKYTYIMTQTK